MLPCVDYHELVLSQAGTPPSLASMVMVKRNDPIPQRKKKVFGLGEDLVTGCRQRKS